jgi:hypothetical protein
MHEFREEKRTRSGDGGGDEDRRLDAYTTPESKAAMRQRTRILEAFRPEKMEASLAQVAIQKERVDYPERALWEAIETMMLDEGLRNRLLDKQEKKLEPSAQDRQDYTRVLSKYRVLVRFVDDEFHDGYKTLDIIPHVKMEHLRVRLADLLANQRFYFPHQPLSLEDRKEAYHLISRSNSHGSVKMGSGQS